MIKPFTLNKVCLNDLRISSINIRLLRIDEMEEYIKSFDLNNNKYVIRELTPMKTVDGTIKVGILEAHF